MEEHQKNVLTDELRENANKVEVTESASRNLQQLKELLRFEELLSEMSARFINLPVDQVDAEIDDAQQRVCECLGLDLSSFWEWETDELNVLLLTHLYRPLGGAPVPTRMTAEEYFPWALAQLITHKMVALSSMKEVPAVAAADLAAWQHFGIKSNLDLLLYAGGEQPLGVLSFCTTQTECTWTDPLIKRLQLVAQIFANALVRKRSEQMLRDHEARLSLAADAAEMTSGS